MNRVSVVLVLATAIFFFAGGALLLQISTRNARYVAGVNTRNALTVVKVIDGDTSVLSDKRHVRYLGINTAEKGEAYSQEAHDLNEKLTLYKQVRLEYGSKQIDMYGRTLALVFVGDIFVNEQIIASGLAITDFMEKNTPHQEDLIAAQNDAMHNCRGMWQGLCTQKAACLQIPHVQADPTGKDEQNLNNEWIEIENKCTTAVDISHALLKDNSSSNRFTFPQFSLLPQQTVTVHSGCGKNTQKDLYWVCPQLKVGVWNNTGDQAFLYDTSGLLIAYFAY